MGEQLKKFMSPGVAVLGVAFVLLIGVLVGTAFTGNGDQASASGSKATSSPSKTASPAASRTPKPSPTPAASSDSAKLLSFRFGCKNPGDEPEYFYTLQDAWAFGPFEHCKALTMDSDTDEPDVSEPSEFQLKALKVAYKTDHSRDKLNRLYGICAQTSGVPIDSVVGEAETAELEGALMLCPHHPKAATIEASITALKDVRAQLAEIDKAKAEGHMVSEGSYLVGPEVQPGTWQSAGEKVENCYWEISDAQGEIIDNNYIRIAPQFTIEIPASASGFTVSGCSFRKVSP